MAHRDDPRTRYLDELARLKKVTDCGGEPEQEAKSSRNLRGDVSTADYDAITDLLDALDPDNPATHFTHDGERNMAKPKTLENYAVRLRLAATEADGDLLNQTTESINQLMAELATGDADIAPAGGYVKGTVGQFQSALKALYRHHDDHNVDPEAIPVFAPDDKSVDERDMFSQEEVQALRDACESPRERCVLELMIFTGQRIRVLQTLQIRDIDLDAGKTGGLYINDRAEGRKEAEGFRPLLGAQFHVRQWLKYHPTGEPDDYLITPAATGGGTPGDQLTQDTIRYHLRRIADVAEVEKDVHPHLFRHFFSTVAVRDWGFDPDEVKQLRGDAPGSTIFETTYRHLTDADIADSVEAKFRDEEPESRSSPTTPDMCDVCDAPLADTDRACSECGAIYAGDAVSVQDELRDRVAAEYRQTDADDAEAKETTDLVADAADEAIDADETPIADAAPDTVAALKAEIREEILAEIQADIDTAELTE